MGEEKVEKTQTAEETLTGGESAASDEGTTSSNSLDFTKDEPVINQAPAPQVGDKYDPRPHEDGARRKIAYLLIGLLGFVVSGMLILLGLSIISVNDIKEFGVILNPIIALVSAATGFYYGTKSNSTNGK
ncbi:MAG: hypothetical protein K2P74_02860 [Nitrosomonas sp.]|nr:hypothetical protein [Nitrosomonas sp.]